MAKDKAIWPLRKTPHTSILGDRLILWFRIDSVSQICGISPPINQRGRDMELTLTLDQAEQYAHSILESVKEARKL